MTTPKEAREDVIWIFAHVEQMSEADEYVSVPRSDWDAMSDAEQQEYLSERALDAMNNAGGCGASVVDESEVPEEWKS